MLLFGCVFIWIGVCTMYVLSRVINRVARGYSFEDKDLGESWTRLGGGCRLDASTTAIHTGLGPFKLVVSVLFLLVYCIVNVIAGQQFPAILN